MRKTIAPFAFAILFSACHESITVGDTHYDSDSGVSKVVSIKNNIQLKENGLKSPKLIL